MTVRDLLLTSEDVDIANDVTDALFPALCPPLYLTPEGEKHFARALDIPVELRDGYAVLLVDGDSWKASYRAARELFTAGAGYCSCEDWDRWFYEDEPERYFRSEDGSIITMTELRQHHTEQEINEIINAPWWDVELREIDQELKLPEGIMGACYLCLIRQAYEPELVKLAELVDMIPDELVKLKLKDLIALRRYKLAR